MLPIFRASLPYTLALAVISFAIFKFLPSFELAPEYLVVIGVLLAGICVPILVDIKSTPHQGSNVAAAQAYTGDTTTLYVGNLPYRANEDAVRELFQRYGIVINVRLMKDRQTGRRRGFGFVEVAHKDGAKMIDKLNDFNFQERTLKVREAKERQDNDDSNETDA
jgi:hypothetical protein